MKKIIFLTYIFLIFNFTYAEEIQLKTKEDVEIEKMEEQIKNLQEYIFSGKRIKRGLYQTSAGKLINADCNGALNILRKSKVVDLRVLYNRGELNTPKRIRVV